MKYIYTLEDNITVERFGGKAYWLSWLKKHNVSIPRTFFIPVCSYHEAKEMVADVAFLEEIEKCCGSMYLSGGVAVRSSGVSEDGNKESKAGNFFTALNQTTTADVAKSVLSVVKSAGGSMKMGVVLQEMVSAEVSGVVFSSNPVNGSKREVAISVVFGFGDKLVSGDVAGVDLTVDYTDGNFTVPENESEMPSAVLELLAQEAKRIEQELNLPVDIEWCYDGKSLTIVQCRPITTIFIEKNFGKISKEFVSDIPQKVTSSDKVLLRLLSEEEDLKISDAYLMVCNCVEEHLPFASVDISRSADCKGYSVVILYPNRIDRKIIRSFIGDKNNLIKSTRCHRYGIRSFPDYESLEKCLESYYQMAKKESWICSIIISEIYDPLYTGIVKKVQGNYVIEFAKGHFVSKGVVPMSTYILDESMHLLYEHEIKQYQHIGIIEGCTLEYGCPDSEQDRTVSLPLPELVKIATTYKNMLVDGETTVEFGVLEKDGSYEPYLIDCVKESVADGIDVDAIKSGVLSEGAVVGVLKKLDLGNFDDSLNAHFYNQGDAKEMDARQKIIFYADLPSIKFLDILTAYEPRNIGFVFAKGSLLCHLSVLLREKGIPAIVGASEDDLQEGQKYLLDTSRKEKLLKQ